MATDTEGVVTIVVLFLFCKQPCANEKHFTVKQCHTIAAFEGLVADVLAGSECMILWNVSSFLVIEVVCCNL